MVFPVAGSSGDEMAEFLALSAKVSAKTASDDERERWRGLREQLRPHASLPPPGAGVARTPRAHPRAAHKLRVRYAAIGDLTVSFTDELGGGGMRLRTQHHLVDGARLLMRLELGGEHHEPLTVEARVIWSRREGGHFLVGLEWVHLRDDERERIEAWAHAHTKEQP
jgi:hypothetical protein